MIKKTWTAQGKIYSPVWDVLTSEMPTHSRPWAGMSCGVSLMNGFPSDPTKCRYHHSCLYWTPCATMTFPIHKNQIKELEKIPGKAAGLTEPMDQHLFNSFLPAGWKGEAGKGCWVCTFLWTPSSCSDRFCLLAKTKCSHSCGVTPCGIDKHFCPLLTEGIFLIFMQRVALLQPSSQFLGTRC